MIWSDSENFANFFSISWRTLHSFSLVYVEFFELLYTQAGNVSVTLIVQGFFPNFDPEYTFIWFIKYRSGGAILKAQGLNYLVSKEVPPWLGPTGIEDFSKLDPLDWLKLTPNSEIFRSKAFIKQEFVEIKKCICNVIKI